MSDFRAITTVYSYYLPEIRQLIDILTRRRQNNPILTGDAGVGKSRLLYEFTNWIDLLEDTLWFFEARAKGRASAAITNCGRKISMRSNASPSPRIATAPASVTTCSLPVTMPRAGLPHPIEPACAHHAPVAVPIQSWLLSVGSTL